MDRFDRGTSGTEPVPRRHVEDHVREPRHGAGLGPRPRAGHALREPGDAGDDR